ncbi:MAG: ATP-binding protein, partial [Verrucomicrobia bacterium]|nr:ATP-binding protein [Verrucomicrobiota bacterium]
QISRIGPHIQFDRDRYEQQGAGLGLIIAKRLTELAGGDWQIEGRLGEGCVVRVRFPELKAESTRAAA